MRVAHVVLIVRETDRDGHVSRASGNTLTLGVGVVPESAAVGGAGLGIAA